MKALPHRFLQDMRELLKDEYIDFINSYNQNRTTGLRVNTLKTSVEEFKKAKLFELKEIPWCEEGFYYDETVDRPGKHPLHEAGVYYIQEPSAMAAAPMLDVKKGEVVLDMCAAPGGKSTYIISKLQGEGLLIANEVDAKRVRILGENIERFGAKNVIITNSKVERLADRFSEFFDKIIIDAPCSGEGMFRKDEEAIRDWSYDKVLMCASIQRELLSWGFQMLKKGGILVYSTCTFSKEENEDMINEFISKEKGSKLLDMHRLWPHKIKGEGHFVAKIEKLKGEASPEDKKIFPRASSKKSLKNNLKDFYDFQNKYLNIELEENLELKGENLYLLPHLSPENLKGISVLRSGLFLGELKKNRFEPSHALSHYLKKMDVKNFVELSDEEAFEYLKGNVLNTGMDRGWILVCFKGFSLGWGKETKGVLKNHYPKGLRLY